MCRSLSAYPRYSTRRKIKQQKLAQYYTLTKDEIELMTKSAKTDSSRLSFAIQLKVFQNLSYFIPLNEVPSEIIDHLRHTTQFHHKLSYGYEGSSNTTLYNHRMKIRAYLQVTKWGKEVIDSRMVNLARKAAIKSAYETSQVMNNIPDIINVVIESLVHSNYELPSFYALNRLVRHTRHSVNNRIFNTVYRKISDSQSQLFLSLLNPNETTYHTMFNQLKTLPKRPSIRKFGDFLTHYYWLKNLGDFTMNLEGIAKVKIEQFAEEAYNLTADEIKEVSQSKQYTLIASLIYRTQSDAKDAIANMFCRLVSIAHKQSHESLSQKLDSNKKDSSNVAEILKNIAIQSKSIGSPADYGLWVLKNLTESGGADLIIDQCDDVLISHGTEHRIFLSNKMLKHRALFFKLLNILEPNSSNRDDDLIKVIKLIQENEKKRSEFIESDIDLSFASEFWKNKVFKKQGKAFLLNRKELETCVIDYVAKGLNSGDLHIKGTRNYSDYRAELLPWADCEKHLHAFCEESNISSNAKEMIQSLKKMLSEKSKLIDDNYHDIPDFIINEDDGRPILKKYEPKPKSESAEKLESLIKSRVPERSLLDILSNAEHYVKWTSECGHTDGKEPKLNKPIEKYILTPFAFGTGLGATQTSKHMRENISARILSRVNKKHFSIRSLNKSIEKTINCLNEFPLLEAWGTGERCAVDGTFEDINDNNMMRA